MKLAHGTVTLCTHRTQYWSVQCTGMGRTRSSN